MRQIIPLSNDVARQGEWRAAALQQRLRVVASLNDVHAFD
jgi:hypothetical protein